MYLNHPRFTYNSCKPLNKNEERIQKFKETGDSRHVYKNELDKAFFRLDIVYADFKEAPRRTPEN